MFVDMTGWGVRAMPEPSQTWGASPSQATVPGAQSRQPRPGTQTSMQRSTSVATPPSQVVAVWPTHWMLVPAPVQTPSRSGPASRRTAGGAGASSQARASERASAKRASRTGA